MRQCFSFDIGRVGSIVTRSPVLIFTFSLCALYRFDMRMYFLYFGCCLKRVISTTAVFCIFVETTVPVSRWICFVMMFSPVKALKSAPSPAAIRVFLSRFSNARAHGGTESLQSFSYRGAKNLLILRLIFFVNL